VFLTALLAACTSTSAPTPTVKVVGQHVSVPGGTYTDVSTAELQTMLANKDFTFVRQPGIHKRVEPGGWDGSLGASWSPH